MINRLARSLPPLPAGNTPGGYSEPGPALGRTGFEKPVDALRGGHLRAALGAAAARLGAALAVLGVVAGAGVGAAAARFGAEPAGLGVEAGAARHQRDARAVRVDAVEAGAEALGHVGVADAGVGADLAGDEAVEAVAETLLHLGVEGGEAEEVVGGGSHETGDG